MLLPKIARTTLTLVQIGCVIHCVDRYLGSFVLCCGDSMIPTLFNRDIVLAENISILNRTVQKGDVIIARSPTDPTQFVCKRLIAMEGDRVWDEDSNHHFVPKGHVWLEGDNQFNSNDSRHYGPIPAGLLTRRVFFKIWPLIDFGTLTHPTER